jgi:hypothetical protein
MPAGDELYRALNRGILAVGEELIKPGRNIGRAAPHLFRLHMEIVDIERESTGATIRLASGIERIPRTSVAQPINPIKYRSLL